MQPLLIYCGVVPGLDAPPRPNGWLRPGVAASLAGAVAALACAAALVAMSGETVGRATMTPPGLTSLPVAAQGPVSAALGRDQPAYGVTGLQAVNAAQRLRASFSRRGVTVASGGARLGMALSAYGYASALRPLGSPVTPRVSANRVSYSRGSLKEWYANGPLGLEQGFDVAARPSAGGGPLTFALALSGNLAPRLQDGSLLLTGRGVALRYGGLVATDARGRVLRSWLQLVRGHVLIRIDDRGAAYPLRIDPFIQNAELTASDGGAGDYLGSSVAISGNTVAVGAPYHRVGSNANQGAVYVFTMPARGWANATQTAELTASDGAAGDGLGYSVAISGNTIVAVAPDHQVGSTLDQGAAYVFTMPSRGWANMTQTAELTASDASATNTLGRSVAISGNTIVAGAPSSRAGSNAASGAVYVFTMPAGGWANATQTAELTASDGAAGDGLGYSVAISGNTIVAGAPYHQVGSHGEQGAAYVFTMPAGGWVNATQTAELTASDGGAGNCLGESVAVSGNTIVADAPDHQVGSTADQGAAYVFTMPARGWANATQTAELTASDGAAYDYLGSSVAVSGHTVVVGAPYRQVGPNNTHQGAVYVFTMPARRWANMTQTAELTASDGAAYNVFGSSVAVSGNTTVIGAPGHTVGANTFEGAAYVFVAAPSISNLRETAKSWREGNALAHISAVKKGKKKRSPGTIFSFALNESARVTFTFTKPAGGRKVGKRCVAQTKKNKQKPRCTRAVVAGTLRFSAHAGTNKVRFEGRVSKHKKLRPGGYTLVVTATASGEHSAPQTLRFKIVS